MTGIGLLKGISTVGEWIEDPARESFLRELIVEEILPTIQLEKTELLTYLDDVIDRFKNPFVAHRLSDISLNSISKIKSRLIPTILDFSNKMGFQPSKLSYCLLGLVLFYLRNPTQIRDTSDVLDWFAVHSNPTEEKENLKQALAKWLDLEWNDELESAYTKLA
jgi:tagaturonate reductase